MSASPILTQGLGSYGSAALLPTLGFGAGAVIVDFDGAGVEYTSGDYRPHWAVEDQRVTWVSGDYRPHWSCEDYGAEYTSGDYRPHWTTEEV